MDDNSCGGGGSKMHLLLHVGSNMRTCIICSVVQSCSAAGMSMHARTQAPVCVFAGGGGVTALINVSCFVHHKLQRLCYTLLPLSKAPRQSVLQWHLCSSSSGGGGCSRHHCLLLLLPQPGNLLAVCQDVAGDAMTLLYDG